MELNFAHFKSCNQLLKDLLNDVSEFGLKSVFIVREGENDNNLSPIIDYYVPFHDRLIFYSEDGALEPMPINAIKTPVIEVVNELKSYLAYLKSL